MTDRPVPNSVKVKHVSVLTEEEAAIKAARQTLHDNGQLTVDGKKTIGPYAGIGPKWPTPRAS